jgi:hypothetical protein
MFGLWGRKGPEGADQERVGIIDAADLDEAVHLVAKTLCARAKGAVELRPITAINM